MEMISDRVELLNSSYNVTEFRISKFNHTTHVFNTKFELFIDIDFDLSSEFLTNYNRYNNNQYRRSLLRVRKSPLCDSMQKFYRSFSRELDSEHSNFPRREYGEKVCPLKKIFNFISLSFLMPSNLKILINQSLIHFYLRI